jgi:hypothetical protein
VTDEEEASRRLQPARLGADVDGPTDGPKPPRLDATDDASLAIGVPDLSAGDGDPDREPADVQMGDRTGCGSIRSTSPASAAVTHA